MITNKLRITNYQQAADDQQAEAPNFPQVKIKEDEETQQAVCLPT